MTTRMAGDSILKAAYREALASEGRAPGTLGSDAALLGSLLSERGSVALGASDLRALLQDAASPRKTASMGTAEKLAVIERYLQDSLPEIAPMVFPVQDRSGVYGASVIDGDRIVFSGLEKGSDGSQALLFVPAAPPGLTHVLENSSIGGPINQYANVLSVDSARGVFRVAKRDGFRDSYVMVEDWQNSPEVSAEIGPIVQRLFRRLQQEKNGGLR